ncbi:regulator of Vps4 activity in the MVB pathway-domain-containing protein [Russula dissimulans]|nr:regulator of Vps4 activity in the MVB pathway-domain-containing protein [Russula dissimulans]
MESSVTRRKQPNVARRCVLTRIRWPERDGLVMAPWNSTKAKVQLRLSVQRLRTLQEKKGAQAKAARRDIATLLERGKVETARIKVESIINEDIHIELLELLELYCELLIARFGLVEPNTREPDPAVSEGICSIIYAAPRTELKELHVLRDLLMHKYGREFSAAVMENRDGCISERVMKKLTNDMPSAELVEAYLSEIARGYGLRWNSDSKQVGDDERGDTQGLVDVFPQAARDVVTPLKSEKLGVRGGEGTPKLPDIPPMEDDDEKGVTGGSVPKPSPEDDFAMLAKRFEALKKR